MGGILILIIHLNIYIPINICKNLYDVIFYYSIIMIYKFQVHKKIYLVLFYNHHMNEHKCIYPTFKNIKYTFGCSLKT
jgi:hypothetical protein